MNKKSIYYLLGLFDLFTLCFYVGYCIYLSKIPFYSDLLNIDEIAINYGNRFFVYLVSLPTLIIYLSLFISSWLYFSLSGKVKWIVLFQMPFRLFSTVFTIPLLFELLRIFEMSQVFYFYIILLCIEVAKVIFLFRSK